MCNGLRRHINDLIAVPIDRQPTGVVHLADHHRLNVPLAADGHELVKLLSRDSSTHAFLRLAHQNLFGCKRRVAQRNTVQPDVHAALAVARHLGRCARDARAAEILDADDQLLGKQFLACLDQNLLGERVANLHARTLARTALVERLGRKHGTPPIPSPPVFAPNNTMWLPTPDAADS